ncbi:hypothetical protein AWB82_06281 [Caballeronia glebae]|uniref:Uncharacterized protein n=1 Tax=Caballeronia glebae TaxID=1777143 RepID=A0A158D531_9BURK|nr:hypothetical protein AWB82_06281 [Caballeronia glebae]
MHQRASEVMILVHMLKRNLKGGLELNHGLTFARIFAARGLPTVALSRLRYTLVNIESRES